ncbi:Transcription termination factor Rho, partial [Ophiophagus hannah]
GGREGGRRKGGRRGREENGGREGGRKGRKEGRKEEGGREGERRKEGVGRRKMEGGKEGKERKRGEQGREGGKELLCLNLSRGTCGREWKGGGDLSGTKRLLETATSPAWPFPLQRREESGSYILNFLLLPSKLSLQGHDNERPLQRTQFLESKAQKPHYIRERRKEEEGKKIERKADGGVSSNKLNRTFGVFFCKSGKLENPLEQMDSLALQPERPLHFSGQCGGVQPPLKLKAPPPHEGELKALSGINSPTIRTIFCNIRTKLPLLQTRDILNFEYHLYSRLSTARHSRPIILLHRDGIRPV